ncbi:MAG: hypothetical protein GXO88_01880, partial [Chlorobi bacterium]|nr:hypothetical protein [Chlorobiota bacterium]
FFDDIIAAIVLLIIYFGTNFYSYTAFSAEMPHNYLFTLYVLIIWLTIRWHKTFSIKHLSLLAVCVGIATLARPTELISILIPLLWGCHDKLSCGRKVQLLISKRKQILVFVSILLSIGLIQIIYWKIFSGKFIYYSYKNPGEGFEFLWPYTLKTLFSFRKGWFVYTPIMIFAVVGFIPTFRKNKKVFFTLFSFFIINLWIVSSWSCWWYAQSMGQRALVQSYAVMAIPLGYFVSSIANRALWLKISLTLVMLFFIILNLFQAWQLRNNILSGDRMTFEYYIKSFGKTKINKADRKLLLINRFFGGLKETMTNENGLTKKIVYTNSFEKTNHAHQSNRYKHSGNYSLVMDSSISYSPGYTEKYKDITDKDYAWIRASIWVYPVHETKWVKGSFVVTFSHGGKAYKYRTIDLNMADLTLHEWNKLTLDYLTPEVRSPNDELKVYIWNRGKKEIYFDDLEVITFD